jgi:diguanylate cyclase (GGDEF)-like protein
LAPFAANPTRIVVVDDDPISIRLLGRMLLPLGAVQAANDGEQALKLMRASPPELVLMDAELPGMSGVGLCQTMKADPTLAEIPVIFVTSHSEPEFEVACFEAGAVDYVQKPVQAPVLLARVQTHIRLKRLSDKLRHSASVDPLTEVANRRAFDEMLEHEWRRAQRNSQPLSLMLIDIDHFKAFNDHYGHPAGDDCLRTFAETLRKIAARAQDLVARYGGEEFAVLLPDTHLQGAQAVADRLLMLLHERAIPHVGSPTATHVTASIGISTFTPTARAVTRRDTAADSPVGPSDLIAIADRALYEAKSGGRSRVSLQPLMNGKPERRRASS